MKSRRFLRLVVHGKVADRIDLRDAVERVRRSGHRTEVAVTWEERDAARLAMDASLAGVDTVVAVGGDGTINEVASGILGARRAVGEGPSLGILPLGTANDFARSAGIPADASEALELVVSGQPSTIDAGRVGDHVFVNVATGGAGAQLTAETPEAMKKVLGGVAYLVTGLTRFGSLRPIEGAFTGPGFEWRGRFLVMAIGNGRQAGGGHVLCPDALVDDGLLDVRILPALPDDEEFGVLRALLSDGLGALERRVVSARVRSIDLRAKDAMQLNLDGEPIEGDSFHIDALPRCLAVHLPEASPLLGRQD